MLALSLLRLHPYALQIQRYTPLHWAVHNGHTAVASLLLDWGADVGAEVKASSERGALSPLLRLMCLPAVCICGYALGCRRSEGAVGTGVTRTVDYLMPD